MHQCRCNARTAREVVLQHRQRMLGAFKSREGQGEREMNAAACPYERGFLAMWNANARRNETRMTTRGRADKIMLLRTKTQ